MVKNKKLQYRLNIDALYGTDISQDRFINHRFHMKRKCILTSLVFLLILICLCVNLYFLSLYKNGIVFGLGEKTDGSSYIGLLTTDFINEEQNKSLDELTFNTLQVTELPIIFNLPLTVLFLIFLIILIDKRNDSKRAVKAKYMYDQIQKIKLEEENANLFEKITTKHEHAPNIIEDEETFDYETP